MMKKVTFFLLVFPGGAAISFLLGLIGCRSVKDTTFLYGPATTTVYHLSNGVEVGANSTCAYDDVYIQTNLEVYEYTAQTGRNWGTNATAMERSPVYRNMEIFNAITVVTLLDYNNHFPAGSDITDSVLFTDLANTDNGWRNRELLLAALNAPDEGIVRSFKFKPGTAPVAQTTCRFAIELHTTKNTVIRDTTVAFVLYP
ncbi:MAG: hypothetical protein QM642_04750 [Edaphocola sp.]